MYLNEQLVQQPPFGARELAQRRPDPYIGTSTSLTWSATDECNGASITTVDLLLSRTGPDGPYAPIASGIANTGSYSWTVTGPTMVGFTAFLKVVAPNIVGNSGLDVSDSGFKIRNNVCSCASYCSEEGLRCYPNGCGLSCISDPSCIEPEPCPENSCGGCF